MKPYTVLALALAAAGASLAGPAPGPGAWWKSAGVRDLGGAPLEPSCRWVVVVCLGRECPVSNASIPELNKIAGDYRNRGVALIGAYVDPDASVAELRAHASDYGIAFPLADDRGQRLARLAGASYTPEVAVFTASGERLYLGSIDDRVGAGGAQKPSATRRYLREVLDAVISGARGPFEGHPGYGCSLPERVSK